MTIPAGLTVQEALRLHYEAEGLPEDGGRSTPFWTMLKFGQVRIRLRNFAWRRKALACHDLHHLLTDYPCTPTGEFQMAAWEFAAGRFPSKYSTLFCLPLVGTGAVVSPRKSFDAFVLGRQSRTVYSIGVTPELLAMELRELQVRVMPHRVAQATWRDRVTYAMLVAASLCVLLTPLIAIALGFLLLA